MRERLRAFLKYVTVLNYSQIRAEIFSPSMDEELPKPDTY
jgi:hypothetical protein